MRCYVALYTFCVRNRSEDLLELKLPSRQEFDSDNDRPERLSFSAPSKAIDPSSLRRNVSQVRRDPVSAGSYQFGGGTTGRQPQAPRSGRLPGADAIGRVLNNQALPGRQLQSADRQEKDLRIGLLVD